MNLIFADTSFFYALAYKKDPHHENAAKLLNSLKTPLITSNYVFDELITILRYDFSHNVAANYGRSIRLSKICSSSF